MAQPNAAPRSKARVIDSGQRKSHNINGADHPESPLKLKLRGPRLAWLTADDADITDNKCGNLHLVYG
jgi:hypothetical protein